MKKLYVSNIKTDEHTIIDICLGGEFLNIRTDEHTILDICFFGIQMRLMCIFMKRKIM